MAEWYYSAGDGVQRGPVDAGGLKRLAAAGRLSPSDLVWREGMTEWAPASKVAGLFASAAPPPPLKPHSPMGDESDFAPFPEAQSRPVARRAYAGFWLRFAAHFVDSLVANLIVFAVSYCAAFTIQAAMGAMENIPTGEEPFWVFFWFVISTGVIWLYYALMESSERQATLGKMAMGIKVTDLNGHRISFGRATGRFFGKILSGLPLMVGFMMAGFTQRKQALHDGLAGTLVVRK